MDDIRKEEELRNQRIAAMKKGREARAANIAARKAAAKATSDTVVQETPVATAEPIQTTQTKPEAPPLRVKRPLSDLFGRHNPNKKTATPAPAVATPAVKKGKAPSVINEKLSHSWYFFLGGGALSLAGFGIMLLGNGAKNPILIALGAAVAGGGAWIFYQGIDRYSVRVPTSKNGKVKRSANSFNITEHGATFDDEASPKGMEWKWLNDGKFYHVHIKGMDGNGGIEEFTLPDNNPDELYFSPSEAINCVKMPMNEKYLNYVPSNTPKFSVVILGIIIGAEIIGLIAIG